MIWLVALILGLVFAPGPASAEPISAAIFTFLASAGLSVGLATTIATFATRILFGAVLSLAGQLLQKKPAVKSNGIQTEQTTTGDVTPQKFVVGTYALEGHAIAPAYSRLNANTILTYILEVSNIPVEGLTGRIIIDGEYATISEDPPAGRAGVETANAIDGFLENGRDHAWLWFEDGSQTSAHPHLVESYGEHPDRPWTADHKLLGSAYAIVEFVFDPDFFNALPAVRFEVNGIKLYDPRKDTTVGGSGSHRWVDQTTWEFSKNPQVINYNILRGITLPTGDIFGGQVPAEDLPLDNWFAAMNECDVLIGDRVQYEAGFEINTNDMEPFDVINEMNRASFAQMSEFGGVYRVRVGAPSEAVLSLTDDDFVITEPSSYDPFPGLANTFNAITGTYVEPNDVWQGRAADAVLNTEWEAEDGNRRLTIDMGLPAVSNKSQAQQLLTAYIKDQRRFRVHRMALPPSFALLEPLDTISWTSEINGYTDKVFEIVEVEDRTDTMIQFVTVRERDAGDVEWTTEQDVPQPAAFNHFTDPAEAIPTLGIPADQITAFIRVVREAVQNVISITVTSSRPDDVYRVEVQYLKTGDAEWVSMGTGTLGIYELVNPDIGSYTFRARTFGLAEQPGEWATSVPVDTQSTFGNPDDVTGFFAEINEGVTTLEWDPVANADLSYYRIRHAVETSGATWANSTTSVDKVPRPGTSVSLPTRPGTYLIKAVDKTGLSSTTAAMVVVSEADAPTFAQSLSDDEHASFAGTKSGVEVNSGRLEITDPSTAPSEGTYDFTGYIETHDSTARRVRARVDAALLRKDEGSGTWDDIPGVWDEFPGTWDEWTGSPQIADTDVLFYISATDDDPSGTPTWSDWRRFRAGEFFGRAFRFRAVLKSTSDNVTPSLDALTAIVEYNT